MPKIIATSNSDGVEVSCKILIESNNTNQTTSGNTK